jgi:hypothetical protein
MLKTVLNPNLYHGKRKKDNFFEGWYFKLVDPSQKYIYCFIPGIILSGEQHSFIQVLEGHNANFNYIKYDKKDFNYNSSDFNITIANNSFSLSEIKVDLISGNTHINGTLSLENTKAWPDSLINPGSMGFYNYLTFMQCYSQVCSIDCNIVGSLFIDGKPINFTGGKAYVEKNWGISFPYSYIWSQCNSFNLADTSLTCSIAKIPLPISSFTGFLIGLYIKGAFYKFTSVNGSKLTLDFSKDDVIISTYNRTHILKFKTHAPSNSFMDLYAPRGSKMIPIARESLQGKLSFELIDKKTKNLLYNSEGSCSGLEFGGNYQTLSIKK